MNINSNSTQFNCRAFDADNTEQVGPVQDNVEHVDVPMEGKKTHS